MKSDIYQIYAIWYDYIYENKFQDRPRNAVSTFVYLFCIVLILRRTKFGDTATKREKSYGSLVARVFVGRKIKHFRQGCMMRILIILLIYYEYLI